MCGQNTPTAHIHMLFRGNWHFWYELWKFSNTTATSLDEKQGSQVFSKKSQILLPPQTSCWVELPKLLNQSSSKCHLSSASTKDRFLRVAKIAFRQTKLWSKNLWVQHAIKMWPLPSEDEVFLSRIEAVALVESVEYSVWVLPSLLPCLEWTGKGLMLADGDLQTGGYKKEDQISIAESPS